MTREPGSGSEQLLFLRHTPLFAGLNETTLIRLAGAARFVATRKGDHLFLQSDPAASLFVLRDGEIVIALGSSDGRELVIAEVHPGDCFGELSLLTTKERTASALAREHSVALELPAQLVLKTIDDEPVLARRLLALLAQRLRAAHEREGALAFLDAAARVARVLLEMDRQDRQGQDKGYVTLSQEEVALRTGLTRQTVAGSLGQWRRAGWLLTGRGRIMLLNRPALRRIEEQISL